MVWAKSLNKHLRGVMVKTRRKFHSRGGRQCTGKTAHLLPMAQEESRGLIHRKSHCQGTPKTNLVVLWFHRMFPNLAGEICRVLK